MLCVRGCYLEDKGFKKTGGRNDLSNLKKKSLGIFSVSGFLRIYGSCLQGLTLLILNQTIFKVEYELGGVWYGLRFLSIRSNEHLGKRKVLRIQLKKNFGNYQ